MMAINPRIYIGSYDVAGGIAFGKEHTYLLYDPDLDGDGDPTTRIQGDTDSIPTIIRGGPELLISSGQITVEIRAEPDSKDKFDGDTDADRNFQILEEGAGTSDLWDGMVAFAQNMGTDEGDGEYETAVDYTALWANSNSVINTVLNAVGIDFRTNTPLSSTDPSVQQSPSEFPGYMTLLDATGANDYTAYSYNDKVTVFIDRADPTGKDTIRIEDGASLVVMGADGNAALSNIDIILEGDITGGVTYYALGWNDLLVMVNGEIVAHIVDGRDAEDNINILHDDGSTVTTLADLSNWSAITPDTLPTYIANLVSAQNAAHDVTAPRRVDPLILDLDGDGVELLSVANGVYWDLDEDGFAEQAGWVSPDDGFLAFDANADGTIDAQDELFGNDVEDGFTQLAAFDTDLNGVIDLNDTDFANLLVWQDANSDGVSQSSELLTLSDWGITEISLATTLVNYDLEGHVISHEGSFTMNGQSYDAVDAWFALDDTNTRYAEDYQLDVRALFLPTLRGYGTLPDLHIAMSLNEDLLLSVSDLAQMSLADMFDPAFGFKAQIEEIMYQWAGVENVDPNTRGTIDARQLGFVEALSGQAYTANGGVPFTDAVARFEAAFTTFYDGFVARLLVQTVGAELFSGLGQYDYVADEFTGTFVLDIASIETVVNGLSLTGGDLEFTWETIVQLVEGTVGFASLSAIETQALELAIQNSGSAYDLAYYLDQISNTYWGSQLDDTLTGTSQNDEIFAAGGNDTLIGNEGDDTLNGSGGNDHIYGGEGADTLEGGIGADHLYGSVGDDIISGGGDDDHYYWAVGDGNDIFEESFGGNDTIHLTGGLTANDISLNKNGDDILIHIGNELITIRGNYDTSYNQTHRPIETILFDDLSTIDLTAGLSLIGANGADTIHGTDFDDTIDGLGGNDHLEGAGGDDNLYGGAGIDVVRGDSGNDILYGGTGADTIYGGVGDDHYYWAVGDGNDSVIESTGIDSLHLTGGLTIENLRFGSAGYNLIIYIGAEEITLLNFYLTNGGVYTSQIEEIVFDDGSTFDPTDNLPIVGTELGETLNGSPGNNLIQGLGGDDTINAGSGDDTVFGGSGDDIINGDEGHDILVGDDGIDTLNGGNGDDTLSGGDGHDRLNGEYGNDTIYGGAGAELIWGAHGNDHLYGGTGNDIIYGGSGDNHYYWAVGDGDDRMQDTSTGTDTLHLTGGIVLGDVRFSANGNDLLLTIGTEEITLGSFYGFNPYTIEWLSFDDGSTFDLTGELPIIGTSGNDVLNGTVGNNLIKGLGGIDTLNGNDGDDTLYGGIGNDILNGESDNDTLFGDDGDDELNAGYGNDFLTGGFGIDELDGSSGDDHYYWAVGDGNDIIWERYAGNNNGSDTIHLTGGITVADVQVSRDANHLNIHIGNETIKVTYHFLTSNDEYAQIEYLSFDDGTVVDLTADYIFDGTSSDDTLNGTNVGETLSGFAGNDTLNGNAGNDTLIGGAGNDTLDGGTGIDTIEYTTAAAGVVAHLVTHVSADGDGGYDTLISIENIVSSAHADIIVGSTEANTITAGAGADQVWSGDGDDTVYGDAGIDTVYGGTGADAIHGGDDNDLLLGELGNDELHGDAGVDKIYGNDGDDTVYGGAGNDTIYGDNKERDANETGNDTLFGEDGNDVILAGYGDDEIYGGNHDDTLAGDAGVDTIQGDAGDDQIWGGSENDILYGDNQSGVGVSGNDIIRGDGGDDTVVAGDGIDTVFGGDGNDELYGNAGNDQMYGDDGDDEMHGGDGNDEIYGDDHARTAFAGVDLIYGNAGDDIIFGGDGLDTIHAGDDNDHVSGDAGNDIINGDAGNDKLYGNAGGDTINGGIGNDFIYGDNKDEELTGGNDILNGGDGDDWIIASGGDDTLNGGDGFDRMYGGAGSDTLESSAGIDLMYGGAGTDIVSYLAEGAGVSVELHQYRATDGGGSRDTLVEIENVRGSNFGDTIVGDNNTNTIYGENGNDYLYGAFGDDTVYGGEGNDIIWGDYQSANGSDGSDTLYGDAGNDTLIGFGGDDTLEGGTGVDTLWGGLGADTFVMENSGAVDIIRDWDTGQGDMLDVSGILDGFYTDPLTQAITDFVQITDNGTNSSVFVDQDGGGDNFVQVGVMYGATGLTDETALETAGTLITV